MAYFGMYFRYGDREDTSEGGGLGAILMMVLAPLAAMMLQLGLSRHANMQRTKLARTWWASPIGLISALQKLGAYNRQIPTTAMSSVYRRFMHRETDVWTRNRLFACSAPILPWRIA